MTSRPASVPRASRDTPETCLPSMCSVYQKIITIAKIDDIILILGHVICDVTTPCLVCALSMRCRTILPSLVTIGLNAAEKKARGQLRCVGTAEVCGTCQPFLGFLVNHTIIYYKFLE